MTAPHEGTHLVRLSLAARRLLLAVGALDAIGLIGVGTLPANSVQELDIAHELLAEYAQARTKLLELLEQGPEADPEVPRDARENGPPRGAPGQPAVGPTLVPAPSEERWARP